MQGEIKIGLACGIESMSYTVDRGLDNVSDEIAAHPVAKDCIQPMGWTSENVAGDFNISRERMDEVRRPRSSKPLTLAVRRHVL